MEKDFIIFGRTIGYFINHKYNISRGIIDNSTETQYILRCRIENTSNEYELKYIDKNKVYFNTNLKDIENDLINLLKNYIALKNNKTFTLNNIPESNYIKAHLFTNDIEIFTYKADEIGDVDSETGKTIFNMIVDYNSSYKLYYKIDENIYSTTITNADIYNGELDNVELDFTTDLELIELPDDYYNYKVKLTNIPEYLLDCSIRFFIDNKIINFGPEPIARTLKVEIGSEPVSEIETNRFIFNSFSDDTISYYVPNNYYKYDLLMEITTNEETKLYKFINPVSDFDIEQSFDFNSFEEVIE